MKSRKKILRVGLALLVLAMLGFGSAQIYLLLAPKTYAATARVRLSNLSNGAPMAMSELPVHILKDDRNLTITASANTSLFDLHAFAPTPERALAHANLQLRELVKNASSSLNARCEVIQSPVANPHAVRPRRGLVLGISSLVAGNLAIAGLGCIAISLAMGRPGLGVRKNLAEANP
jgi:hypothetical protein